MLVLTRKTGEKIFIGDDVYITVVDVKGDSVRIAVEAPKSVKVYRGEIYDAIVAENRQAALNVDLAGLDSFGKSDVKKPL